VIKRLAAVTAALALMLLVAAPAVLAQALHQQTPIPWNEGQFQGTEEDCADANLQPGQVLWHFVGHFDTANATMDATFSDAQFNVNDMPPTAVHDTYELHWDIVTTQTTLLSASVTPDTTTDGFNLSHICTNPPTEIPEAPFSALLVLSAGLTALGYFGLRRRRSASLA